MMIILVFGDNLFAFILGKKWEQAGTFAQYMAPWVYVVFVASPVSNLYLKLSQQRRLLHFNMLLLSLRTLALLATIYLFKEVDFVVLVFSLTGFLIWFVLYLREIKISNLALRKFSFKLLMPLVAGLLLLAVKILLINEING